MDNNTPDIQTARLLLRRWRESDASDLYEYACTELVGPDAGWQPHKNPAESLEIIQKVLSRDGTWAVTLAETGKVIGSVGLHDTDVSRANASRNALEIGYVLSPDYWRRGYILEAVTAIAAYAFWAYGLDDLWIACFDYNVRSRRVCEKLGTVYVGDKQSVVEALGNKPVTERLHILSKSRFYELNPHLRLQYHQLP